LQEYGKSKVANGDSLVGSLQVDSSKIRQTLDWTPSYSIEKGLQAIADWLEKCQVANR
jgi:nucleoside-diphosphate-sugar epimerase